MWKLLTAEATGGHPLLSTLNNFQGRQVWNYDADAGTPEEKEQVESARKLFTRNRHTQKHSSDELLRLQCADKIANATFKMPAEELPAGAVEPDRVADQLRAGMSFYECLQQDDGHWPGDYGGPMFLMPGLLITLYTAGALDTTLTPHHKAEMIRYLSNHANEDGGFGLHIEGGSTMFGTALK
jgi:cycloartenol synthase